MKDGLNQAGMVDKIKNTDEVRVYRLHLLETNQQKILDKIDDLEIKLEENYSEKLKDHETRLKLVETVCSNYIKLKWIIIVEAIGILGLILKTGLQL